LLNLLLKYYIIINHSSTMTSNESTLTLNSVSHLLKNVVSCNKTPKIVLKSGLSAGSLSQHLRIKFAIGAEHKSSYN